jgi:hypothetical protein
MGPYCDYCDQRCFVLRVLPVDAKVRQGEEITMATCPEGMGHDRDVTGYDHRSVIDPMTFDPHRDATLLHARGLARSPGRIHE